MKKGLILVALATGIVAIAGFSASRAMAGGCGMHGSNSDGAHADHQASRDDAAAEHKHHDQAAPATQPAADAKFLADALKAIEAARQAIQNADTETALAELDKAQALIAQAKQSEAKPAAFANATCPIMGSKINPAKVPDSLVREYKGKQIAFCCGGCPSQWDKLSDAQKDAKLKTN